MGSYRPLPEGYPDPYDLLRDPEWLQNYPIIALRGIHSVMTSGRVRGNAELRFKGAFNITVMALLKAHPPRLHRQIVTRNGNLTKEALSPIGITREKEVRGEVKLSPKSRRRYGDKSPKEMRRETVDKLNELRVEIEIIRRTTPEEGMPPHLAATKITGLP